VTPGHRFWFFPVRSGDFRLQATSTPGETLLSVEDPTDSDRKLLIPFLKTAVEMGQLETVPEIRFVGLTEISLKGTVEELGPILADHVHADSKLWTAVRHTDGKIFVTDGAETELKQLPVKRKKAEIASRKEAAATVREPWVGCPPPETAVRRASEVLRTFSTRSQWEQWEEHGAMKLIGNATGKAYWLHHRSVAAARGLLHLLIEAKSGRDICVWDDRVPAEEEALAIKFAVEHRENWLRGVGTLGVRL